MPSQTASSCVPFKVGPDPTSPQEAEASRRRRIVNAVLELSEMACEAELEIVDKDFTDRHWQTRQIYLDRFEQIKDQLGLADDLTWARKTLIGAYFCHEYSYASAALMNPSIVPHPDQSGLKEGQLRFVMSLRAVGEGHISSIVFREGIVDTAGRFTLDAQPPFSITLQPTELPRASNNMSTLAERHAETSLSGTVIFPITAQQRGGLEDLRLVKFEDGDEIRYFGTYTAYNGSDIASELLITDDFNHFKLCPMSGVASRNKGMAIFPRKIDGSYALISRQDGENLFYLRSEDLLHWEQHELLLTPKFPWELVQIGNCGSPIEIDEGWLLLTHGVGPMRKYCIGAVLLDKNDPRRVLGRTATPILTPQHEEREGYVPNVVYTCGAIALGRQLFVPYGIADSAVAFCWIDIDSLISNLT